MKTIYSHSGSKNHGCEALVRTVVESLCLEKNDILYSYNYEEDLEYGLQNIITVKNVGKNIKKWSFLNIISYVIRKLFKSNIIHDFFNHNYLLKNKEIDIAISIGGDVYCYGNILQKRLAYLNTKLNKIGAKTALIGCSIEPNLFNRKNIIDDLHKYSLITARESLTYEALINAGIRNNVKLIPDSAFILPIKECDLPNNFILDNTVGINVSPLIERLKKEDDSMFKNYAYLVEYIIKNTDMNIAFIPHVLWSHDNDLEPLTALYNLYKGTNRVCLVDENKTLNCMELKYIISKCRFMVTARTHAAIASYSTYVPTLVVGYSIKAKGIAKDIFGTYENYVISIQEMKNPDDLTKGFHWIVDNEIMIKESLCRKMNDYKNKVYQLKEIVETLDSQEEK